MEPLKHLSQHQYVDGEWVESANRNTRDIINPRNQEVIFTVSEGAKEGAERAILTARRTFESGEQSQETVETGGKRARVIADKIKKHRRALARLEALDTGKTLEESYADMDGIHNVSMYFAGLADKDGDETIDLPIPDTENKIVKKPVGVVTQITPWNYPLLQAPWKITPALATGCSLVMKLGEITPLTTICAFELMEEIGFPKGTINLILGIGSEVGDVMSGHKKIDLVSFTGGIEAGKHIIKNAANNITNIVLELGDKDPDIVFDDADFKLAVNQALNGGHFHAGQVCSAGSKILVQNSIKGKFEQALIDRMKKVKLGSDLDADAEMGPVISTEHRNKIESYMGIAKAEGATVAIGGKRPDRDDLKDSLFFEPTVITNRDTSVRIVQEEAFGPVVTVEGFEIEREAIQLANSSIHGLTGAVFSKDIEKAQRVANKLKLRAVWISDFHPYFAQAPWGGYKQPGIDKELGKGSLEECLVSEHILTDTNP